MRSEIPADIWRYVAGFLPVAVLLTLFSVNRTFLEIVTETRYRAINFTSYKDGKPLMKHVKDSELVHSVRVQPWMVEPKGSTSHSWASSTWKLLHGCVSPSFEDSPEAQIARRMQKQTRRVADTIRALPELHKYHIDWDEGPCYQTEFFSALLDMVIPNIGHRLCALALKIPLHHMPSLPSLARHLPALKDLSLTLHTGVCIPMYICEKMEGLEVFVNALLRNLRTFSLSTTPTSIYLDLGPFFGHLGHGLHLTSFALCIPFDGGHLADPAPLRRFLSRHRSTLEAINLGTTRAAAHSSPGASTAKFWIRDTFKNPAPFPALSHLSLGLRPLRTDLGPLLRHLSGLRSQLRILKLSERPLEYAELVHILAALDSPPLLRVLSLRLRWLSPEIVDLLAAGLPELTALDLNFTEVVHQENMFFCQAMNGKSYQHWNLTRLAVPESPRGQKWLDALECTFVGCIPALSFAELVSV
ncbi:hypothetical protein B0H14DRAFT_2867828 [Mycena olivaceomarginata]|nr:hypothetical protein B0H14DRAFT_2867828 [Mycena olivaceomarginata]